MILQALLSIAIATVIAGAILTSALVNANVAAHQAATRLATAALSRGTDEFVNWAQRYVAKHGSATTWPTTPIVDQPVAACETSPCNLTLTLSRQVIGSTLSAISGPDLATNLQVGLAEGRLSGSISATITDVRGNTVSSSTDVITMRTINVPPFVILSGVRSFNTISSSQHAAEGDTAGTLQRGVAYVQATPDPANPTIDTNTVIFLKMTCSNSSLNDYSADPLLDNKSPGNDSLPWGASGGRAFEAPCVPGYHFTPLPPIPTDAQLTTDNIYSIDAFRSTSWAGRNNTMSSWPH